MGLLVCVSTVMKYTTRNAARPVRRKYLRSSRAGCRAPTTALASQRDRPQASRTGRLSSDYRSAAERGQGSPVRAECSGFGRAWHRRMDVAGAISFRIRSTRRGPCPASENLGDYQEGLELGGKLARRPPLVGGRGPGARRGRGRRQRRPRVPARPQADRGQPLRRVHVRRAQLADVRDRRGAPATSCAWAATPASGSGA